MKGNIIYYLFYRFINSFSEKGNKIKTEDINHTAWMAMGKISMIEGSFILFISLIFAFNFPNEIDTFFKHPIFKSSIFTFAPIRSVPIIIVLPWLLLIFLQYLFLTFRGKAIKIVAYYDERFNETNEERQTYCWRYNFYWVVLSALFIFLSLITGLIFR